MGVTCSYRSESSQNAKEHTFYMFTFFSGTSKKGFKIPHTVDADSLDQTEKYRKRFLFCFYGGSNTFFGGEVGGQTKQNKCPQKAEGKRKGSGR